MDDLFYCHGLEDQRGAVKHQKPPQLGSKASRRRREGAVAMRQPNLDPDRLTPLKSARHNNKKEMSAGDAESSDHESSSPAVLQGHPICPLVGESIRFAIVFSINILNINLLPVLTEVGE